MRKISIGDIIHYKPWGNRNTQVTKVLCIEICKPGQRSGREVASCDLDKHSEVVLDLDDNHWCYKEQIISIESKLPSTAATDISVVLPTPISSARMHLFLERRN